MAQMLLCWNCGRNLEEEVPLPISRQATCRDCYNSLHCCRMCRHYAPTVRPGQCENDLADPPLIKENGNFCEYFKPARNAFRAGERRRHDVARDRFAALFGGDDSSDEGTPSGDTAGGPADPRARLDDLFND